MCDRTDAVQARYDAALDLKYSSKFGRIDEGLKGVYNEVLREPIPGRMQKLVNSLAGK